MNFKLLNVKLRLKLAVLFFLTVTLVPVIAASLDGIVIPEEEGWSLQVTPWKKYITQNLPFSTFTDRSTLEENKELTLPLGIGLYLGLADRLNRTLPFLAQESITYTISTLDELLKIRSSALRDATQEERDIILAATAQTALYRYKEHKRDTKELFTVDYWTDYFTARQEEGKLDFSSTTVNDTLHTRAVAAAITINKVYGKFYVPSELQESSGMSPEMFNNLVKEIDKAASSVITKHALTAAKTGNLVTQFNLATMLARKENLQEKRQQAYGLFEEIAVTPEVKDRDIQAMALLQMAQLLQEKVIEPKEYLSFSSLTPKRQEKMIESKEKPLSVNSSMGKKEKKILKSFVSKKKLTPKDVPTIEQYTTSLRFNAWMITEVVSVVPRLARGVLENEIEKGSDSSQIRSQLEGLKRIAKPKFGQTQNNGEYAFRLGRVFYSGIRGLTGYEEDKKQAFSWFSLGAEKGYREAQFMLAVMYENGEGTEKNMNNAYKWYLESIQKPEARLRFARMKEEGEGTEKNVESAFNQYMILAQQENADAQYAVARIWKNRADETKGKSGSQIGSELENAFNWYFKAAQQGYSNAPYIVAGMLYNREGIGSTRKIRESRDPSSLLKETLRWYLKAAQQGNTYAQYGVATMLENGEGISPNPEEAFKWYERAFKGHFKTAQEEDDAYAQYMVGLMYEQGQGTGKNLKNAFDWYLKAAQQEDEDAQYAIGLMYEQGQGTDKDLTKASEWYKKAEAQGHEGAKQRLAEYVDEY